MKHVRTNGGDGGHNFAKLQLVKDGRLSGSIKANHQYSHFSVAEQGRK